MNLINFSHLEREFKYYYLRQKKTTETLSNRNNFTLASRIIGSRTNWRIIR